MELVADKYPRLKEFLDAQLAAAPDQEKFFRRRFQGSSEEVLQGLDELANHIYKLIDGRVERYANDYVWICETMLEEELHFRRNGRYRLSTFEEAYREVYSNADLMTHYMNGLLMTQLWWSNHTGVMDFYRKRFLATNKPGYSHLEIGPGHGLFLYFAAADPRAGAVHGWDVAAASVDMTADALRKLGLKNLPKLELVDLFKGPTGSFDSVVFSEVLEHLDRPREALEVLRSILAPGGRLFLNVPINSPAPDHLFNAATPEALEAFVSDAGFRIEDRALLPATNQSLEDARKKKLTISCAFIATKA